MSAPGGAERPAAASEMNDLLARVAASGDREAFSRLFAFFAPRVKGYLMRIGLSPDQAEDLAQDALLKVWRKARLFDPSKASAATWIYTIARNLRIDAARRLNRPLPDHEDPALLPEEEPRADVELERAQRDRRIHAAFDALPPNQRAVVMLHFYEDEPHAAIAERLDLPLGTVKSRLRLAFGRIRKELGDLA
ncbi:RNA polymerase sigma-70 factor, ECF subfamily [Amphiplicatus metriothermophilus]|uniref:RNA polymerase sigma factor n=2 Tax=Amphiplicatus metriothermophilus TaxID=1519374 RepID=A0A239PVW5_9PROT|nr:RNA polymerase sigma-70 factor, ECF subfamily [Amphiplicatus metriothermophilus]